MNTAIEHGYDRPLTEIGAKLLRAYLECGDELQHHAREMVSILSAEETDEDERAMALHTLAQIFFPERTDCAVTVEHLDECSAAHQADGVAAISQLDLEERTFAERLEAFMRERGVSQHDLASRIGVSQPAISLMLKRQCRPQRRTVSRIAAALGVAEHDLWPASAAG